MKDLIRPVSYAGLGSLCAQGLAGVLLNLCTLAHAEEVQFNEAFLPAGSRGLDLSLYQKNNPVLAGIYRADVTLNGQLVSRQEIRINADKNGGNPVVCINRKLLELAGVDMNRLSADATLALDSVDTCPAMAELIENATASFIPATQVLDLSVPQVALRLNPRGYVGPELWDRGVTAGTLGYNFNANHNQTRGGNYDSAYLGLNAGLNLGDWRLRHNGSLTWQGQTGQDYQSLNTYAQHDVTALKSQLTLGESNTSGEIFDTVGFSGLQLNTDDRMFPESQRGYAPVIRGIARTSARVSIRQNGNLLYETMVAPGAFAINDLYSTGYGGDLSVTVTEADGSTQNFTVPYAPVSQLLRPGTLRYSMTAGETRNTFASRQVRLVQGTVQYGLSNLFTGYGGMQASTDYGAALAGLAVGTSFGSMALDVTQAQTRLATGSVNGQSVRLSYSKDITRTGTHFTVATYRFSTSGFMDLNTAVQTLAAQEGQYSAVGIAHPRSRLSLTANQDLGDWGQLAISGFTQDYWTQSGSDVQYQFSYNKQLGKVSYNLSANRSRVDGGALQNNLLLTISMPLDFGSPGNSPQLSTMFGRNTDGRYSEQASLSGSAGADRQYTYGVTAGHDGASATSTGSVNGQYTGSDAVVGASYSQGGGYNSLSLSANGSVVAHPGGITFTPNAGETMAILSAPGAEGAKVVGYPGIKLDDRGNAVVTYLRPYELNELAIDPLGISQNIELSETSQQIAPRAGAVVMVKYGTQHGQAWLLTVRLEDGSLLPFGATVSDAAGGSVGTVGQGGQLYARVKEGTSQLLINWGAEAGQQCVVTLPAKVADDPELHPTAVLCTPSVKIAKVAP